MDDFLRPHPDRRVDIIVPEATQPGFVVRMKKVFGAAISEAIGRWRHIGFYCPADGRGGQVPARRVGVMAGKQVLHMAPPVDRVPQRMGDLFGWLQPDRCWKSIVKQDLLRYKRTGFDAEGNADDQTDSSSG